MNEHVTITALSPDDDATIDQVVRLQAAARAVEVPDFPPPDRASFAGLLRHRVSAARREFRVARSGDEVVGYLEVVLPMRDNTENSEITLEVHPAHRRRGVGRALYSYALDMLRELGRKRVMGYSVEPLPGGPERNTSGSAFANAVGAKGALDEVRRRLDLSTVDEGQHSELLTAAWAKADGYELVTWRNRVPDEYAADVGYLDARMVTDAPMGDLAWEPENIDTARIRESEAAREARGIRTYEAGVVHAQCGRLVALTALGFEPSPDWHANQWITIVDPDHRGHRLGMVVKLENLRFAREHEPALRIIDTWNAGVNDHMISINEAMGFRPVDNWVNWQHEF